MSAAFDLPSPCVSVCEIDPQTQYCRGCLRTTREIAAWGRLDHDGRLALLEALRERRRELGLPMRKRTRRRDSRRSAKSDTTDAANKLIEKTCND